MGTAHIFLLSVLMCYAGAPSTRSGLVLSRNKRNVKSRAELRSCARHNCSNIACSNIDGWHLYGSDWGCCGNYDGCCTWASVICYAHDVICQCCDYGWWCGPDCRREPECFRPGRKIPNRYGGLDPSFVNQIPQKEYFRNTNGVEQAGRNNTWQSNRIPNGNVTNKLYKERTSNESESGTNGENLSETVGELARNEGENIQNITQEFNFLNVSSDELNYSSFVKNVETGEDSQTENVTQDAINKTSELNQHERNLSDKANRITNQHSSSSETKENKDETYNSTNQTSNMTNFSGEDGEFNSTGTFDDSRADSQPGEGETGEPGNSDELLQNDIPVARTSSDDSVQDSLEEDGSGQL
ncbi:uncharacterized protein LOC117316794 [Pecten maximus]|uniref:uncharacterized protein LOC117316794 n=1 Tax=Pecten maximus TaxID=6579 RepID=UPI00145913F3|nr:uncharacterized protein LOC117316794 [Pecten maximus]